MCLPLHAVGNTLLLPSFLHSFLPNRFLTLCCKGCGLGIDFGFSGISSICQAGTGPGGPPTFLLRQKSRQKRRPQGRCPCGVPEQMRHKAGSETNSPSAQTGFASCPLCAAFVRQRPRGFERQNPIPTLALPLKGRELRAVLAKSLGGVTYVSTDL